MIIALSANPGQRINLPIQVTDGYGSLHDGYQAPTVDFVLLPNGSLAAGYPSNMTQIALGIWTHTLIVPTGLAALGSYVISCSWPHPETAIFQNQLFLLNVALPFGNSTIIPA